MRLNYSTYANILYNSMELTTGKTELPELLLPAAFPEIRKKTVINDIKKAGTDISRWFTGDRDIQKEIKQQYSHNYTLEQNMPALVEQHFKQEIMNRLDRDHDDNLINAFVSVIHKDKDISQEQRSAFLALAKKDTLCKFLAETFIYAVKQKKERYKPDSIIEKTGEPLQIDAFLNNPANRNMEYNYIITHSAAIACVESFVERQELEDIYGLIESGQKRILITGMGGNGKSEICRQIYNRLEEKIPWVEHAGYFIYDNSMDETLYNGLKFQHSADRRRVGSSA